MGRTQKKLTKQINCFVSEEEFAILQELANKNGLNISAFLRYIIAYYKNNAI